MNRNMNMLRALEYDVSYQKSSKIEFGMCVSWRQELCSYDHASHASELDIKHNLRYFQQHISYHTKHPYL